MESKFVTMETVRFVILLWNGPNMVSSVTTVMEVIIANDMTVGLLVPLQETLGTRVSIISIIHVVTRMVNIPLNEVPRVDPMVIPLEVATLLFPYDPLQRGYHARDITKRSCKRLYSLDKTNEMLIIYNKSITVVMT